MYFLAEADDLQMDENLGKKVIKFYSIKFRSLLVLRECVPMLVTS